MYNLVQRYFHWKKFNTWSAGVVISSCCVFVSFLAANTLWKQIKYWEANETQHLETCILLFYISNKNDTWWEAFVNRQAWLVSVQNYPGLISFQFKDVSVQSVGVLGTIDHRWHRPFNGTNLLARVIRARSTMSQRLIGPMFQGNIKTTAIVVYLD